MGSNCQSIWDYQTLAVGALLAGQYVQIRVEDNGCGMDEVTRQRVFEPFYTTKGPGKGTGLGLSAVHGTNSSHDGAMTLESSLGGGTKFDVFLPVTDCAESTVALSVHEGMPDVMGNGERVLKRARFNVSVVHDPNEAVKLPKEDPQTCDVLVTDYNMSGLSGLDLIEIARAQRPGLPTILISGYVSDDLLTLCAKANVRVVLEKQKSLHELTAAIEKCLEGERGSN